MRKIAFPEHLAVVHLEDRQYIFEQHALCREVGKLAQGLRELHLKTAVGQYFKDPD